MHLGSLNRFTQGIDSYYIPEETLNKCYDLQKLPQIISPRPPEQKYKSLTPKPRFIRPSLLKQIIFQTKPKVKDQYSEVRPSSRACDVIQEMQKELNKSKRDMTSHLEVEDMKNEFLLKKKWHMLYAMKQVKKFEEHNILNQRVYDIYMRLSKTLNRTEEIYKQQIAKVKQFPSQKYQIMRYNLYIADAKRKEKKYKIQK